MSAELEKALNRLCEEDPRNELLRAQWAYDKRLLSQALQTVGNTFPHYSLHDASHSNTILIQITRILGERVDNLSATDIWLLLESAYWHDMGMVVDEATVRKWWGTEEFDRHLAQMEESEDATIAHAARLLKSKKLFCESSPLDVKHAVTVIVAEFARQQHAKLSGNYSVDPMKIGLKTPRVLIPARLFGWLSKIVIAHGESHEYVMDLPYSECGMGTDVCHPRLIASLLRLGDLLDLDNGRFCPVLAGTLGKIPETSLAHMAKHASIRRFDVNPAKIEVEAYCVADKLDGSNDNLNPYAAFEAAASWLDWLEQEIKFLSSRWADIAPADFGGAPSVGTIEAQLEGYVCFEKTSRPKFSVDESAFLGLVRSNNLYEDRFAWLRELLANSDDASRIRLFQEQADGPLVPAGNDINGDPFEHLGDKLERFPIRIDLEELDHPQSCRVTIQDRGTGISFNDLKYILEIGSSRKNPHRKRVIKAMPDYLQPTGSFGIGLQSVFLITNRVRLITRHFQTGDCFEILIWRTPEEESAGNSRAPTERRSGIYIRYLEQKERPQFAGTKIEFEIIGDNETGLGARLNDDPPWMVTRRRASDSSDVTEGLPMVQLLTKKLERDATSSCFPIYLGERRLKRGELERKDRKRYYDPGSGCFIIFDPPNSIENEVNLFYRGAKVKHHELGKINLLNVGLDLHFGNASLILTASRESLTEAGNQIVADKLKEALQAVFPRYLEYLKDRVDKRGGQP